MFDKVLMTLIEVDIGLGTDLLPPIIQVIMIDHLVLLVIVIIEVYIGMTSANFLHITMLE